MASSGDDDGVELFADELPEAFFSTPTPFGDGQREGPLRGRGGKQGWGIRAGHNNRSGHRLYVKINQSRERRRNLVGFGRWRRQPPRWKEESWAALSAPLPQELDRPVRRAVALVEYRTARLRRCRKVGLCSCGGHGSGPKVPKWSRRNRRMVP